VVNYLQAVGIRVKLKPLERAAFYGQWADKKLRHLVLGGSGAPGIAQTRVETYAVTGGRYVTQGYPDIDGLFTEQVNEMNPRVRAQVMNKIQQMIHERTMFAPVVEPCLLNGVGPRVEQSGLAVIANHAYSAPYEDVTLKRAR
jgi:peptide/nickel transport system substrate-binding protein